jgi:hypothetical protein
LIGACGASGEAWGGGAGGVEGEGEGEGEGDRDGRDLTGHRHLRDREAARTMTD